MNPKPTILFVDDDQDFLDSLREVFYDRYEILSANNPEDGLAMLDAHRESIQAMVVDMWMPHRDDSEMDKNAGLWLLQRLQERSSAAHHPFLLPVIVLTGHGSMQSLRECLNAGASNYVVKGVPKTTESLAERLAFALRSHAPQFSTPSGRLVDQQPHLHQVSAKLTEIVSSLERLKATLHGTDEASLAELEQQVLMLPRLIALLGMLEDDLKQVLSRRNGEE